MVRPGGLYILTTAVKGCYGHGLHTFNPEGIIEALGLNGFEIVYLKYYTSDGKPLEDPSYGEDVGIWIVSKKIRSFDKLAIPQQKAWREARQNIGPKDARFSVKSAARAILRACWKKLSDLKYAIKRFLD
jgi:hypothetical protein